MKILLANPRYPQTFWSFERVVRMLNKRAMQPPLGLITLAALLPRDWQLVLADLVVRELTEEDWQGADVLMITGLVSQRSGILSLIHQGNERGLTVVVGGPWVFHFPEEALKAGANIVVKGEAELVIPELIEAVTKRKSGLILKAAEKPDLRTSPVPRFDLLDLTQYVDMVVQFSRGCPFQCEFCDVTLMLGQKMRTKSPQQALEELKTLYDLGWRRGVFVADDNFIGSLSSARALLKELVPWMVAHGHPFEFNTQASVNLAAHPDVIDLMVKAGFWKVFLGIETTDEESLQQARKHQNVSTNLDNVCEVINRAGLQIIAGCIIGFDAEKKGAGRRLAEFAGRTKIPEMFVTLLQAVPGTDMWRRLESEGRLLKASTDDSSGSQTAEINFITVRPEFEIIEEFVALHQELYEPVAYMERCFAYFSRMRQSPPKKKDQGIILSEIRTVQTVIWRQGVVYPSRWQFWKHLLAAVFTFPSQLRRYFSSLVVAEHYYEYRHTIRAFLEERMKTDRRN
jgi:radical SAM superfamily enzyme YgiQ (UPF0313 family)